VCPLCHSLPRHRIACEILNQNNFFISNALLIAPNYGLKIWFEMNKIIYKSADLYDKTTDMRIDIQKTNFSENTFDFISCDHVLEHVTSWKMALKELYRITKKGGYVEITVPILTKYDATFEDSTVITAIDRFEMYGQIDHLRIFGNDFEERLSDIGFNVCVYNGDDFDANIVPISAPAISDINKIFICKK
jgi:SAM-dependent methyltransferase